jgi:transposase
VRVTTKLMADSRRRARGRGKSDRIDALAVARAALREGLDTLPAAQLQGPELDLRLLVDHRERLVRQRVALNNTLQWHLHDLWPELRLPGSSLFYGDWGPRVARRLARAEQTMRVRIAQDELRRIRELSQTIKSLEAEIAALVAQIAPHLLSEPGFGPLTAAKLVGEIAGAGRFTTDAKLARAAGVAPIPVSSGTTNRHRLDRGGNRQINATIHRIAVTRLRCHPETQDYVARKRAEGKSTKEAIRCLKATSPAVSGACSKPPRPEQDTHTHQFLDKGAAKQQSAAPARVPRDDRLGRSAVTFRAVVRAHIRRRLRAGYCASHCTSPRRPRSPAYEAVGKDSSVWNAPMAMTRAGRSRSAVRRRHQRTSQQGGPG